jgi:hypothetical protein
MANLKVTFGPTKKAKDSEYFKLPDGVTWSDYDMPLTDIPDVVKVRGLDKAYRHVQSSEATSKALEAKEKAKEEGNLASFDQAAFLHAWRMQKRGEWLDGTWGTTRGAGIVVLVDPITEKMKMLIHEKLLKFAVKKGRTEFPDEFNATTAKFVMSAKTGRTLGQMISEMIETDDGTVRAKATKMVEEEKAAKAARLAAESDDDAELEDAFDEDTVEQAAE